MDVQLYTWNGNGEPESLRTCSKMSDLLESYALFFTNAAACLGQFCMMTSNSCVYAARKNKMAGQRGRGSAKRGLIL